MYFPSLIILLTTKTTSHQEEKKKIYLCFLCAFVAGG